jgi:ABC-type ATPase involved in cell division
MTDHSTDHPIHSPKEDLLDRAAFVKGLGRALVKKKDGGGYQATSVVLGLTGPWGSGKSSIINLLKSHLLETGGGKIAVAVFNPWLVHGRDALLEAYFSALREAIGKNLKEHLSDWLMMIDKYRRGIKFLAYGLANAVDAAGAGGTATVGASAVNKTIDNISPPDNPSYLDEKKTLEKKLETRNVAVVVLVDELDRVEDDDVRAVAQLIKAVGDIKGISYLVAYDPDRVADALGRGTTRRQRLETGHRYIEKIIQHPIPIRPMFEHDVDRLLRNVVEENLDKFKQKIDTYEYGSDIFKVIVSDIKTPRELKRLIGTFNILNNMLDSEIPNIDLLGYCWILTKLPSLRNRIADHFDDLVDHPADPYRRLSQTPTGNGKLDVSNILGKEANLHRQLLEFLFPRFGKQRSSESTDERISGRRNIIRLLYLGDPPHQVSRKAVDALWCKAVDETIDPDLKVLIDKNELGDFLDRLEDVLPSLSVDGDSKFWLALSKALVRPTDWLLKPEPNGNLADDAAAVLLNFGTSSDVNRERCKSIIKALMDSDDYTLLPKIVRRHLFAHGLVENQEKRNGKTIFDRDETLELVENVYKHFVNELSDGKFLRKILNGDALFMLIQSGLWTVSETHSFTDLLENPDARKTVAALLTPPGYSIDKEALQGFMDVDKVLGFMKNANEGDTANDVWIDTCLRRFRAALEGKSLWNLND